jgi:hypothetical protein
MLDRLDKLEAEVRKLMSVPAVQEHFARLKQEHDELQAKAAAETAKEESKEAVADGEQAEPAVDQPTPDPAPTSRPWEAQPAAGSPQPI